jgi:hypothetical protein
MGWGICSSGNSFYRFIQRVVSTSYLLSRHRDLAAVIECRLSNLSATDKPALISMALENHLMLFAQPTDQVSLTKIEFCNQMIRHWS